MTLLTLNQKPNNYNTGLEYLIDKMFINDWNFDSKCNMDLSLPIDIKETSDSFQIIANTPGLKKNDVKVEISDQILTISGKMDDNNKNKNERYHYKERIVGLFKRSFKLPNNVDQERISASLKSGILTINLKKCKDSALNNRAIKVN